MDELKSRWPSLTHAVLWYLRYRYVYAIIIALIIVDKVGGWSIFTINEHSFDLMSLLFLWGFAFRIHLGQLLWKILHSGRANHEAVFLEVCRWTPSVMVVTVRAVTQQWWFLLLQGLHHFGYIDVRWVTFLHHGSVCSAIISHHDLMIIE